VIDASALQMVLAVFSGWLDRQERQAIVYLMEENRILRRQLGQRRLTFTDTDRRRLAVRGHRLGRHALGRDLGQYGTDRLLSRRPELQEEPCICFKVASTPALLARPSR
jgi:hypothetical protein